MENIQTAIRSGETLIQALARLQKDGKLMAFGQVSPDFSTDQRVVLEALLGKDLIDNLSSGAFSSEEIEGRIRQHLEEKLSSGNASELLAKGQWGAEESSLFSAPRRNFERRRWWFQLGNSRTSSWAAAALHQLGRSGSRCFELGRGIRKQLASPG